MKRKGVFWEDDSVTPDRSKRIIRILTSGEISLARSVFEDTIEYNKVWIHNDSYLSAKMQGATTAMTPDGEMYYPDAVYSPDFSSRPIPGSYETVARASHLFIHEMTHVWQYQRGYLVKLHGLFSWAANYHYDLNLDSFGSYSPRDSIWFENIPDKRHPGSVLDGPHSTGGQLPEGQSSRASSRAHIMLSDILNESKSKSGAISEIKAFIGKYVRNAQSILDALKC